MKKRYIIGFLICLLFGACIVAVTNYHKQYEENLRIEEEQRQEAKAEQDRKDLAEKKLKDRQQLVNNIDKVIQQDNAGMIYSVYADFLDGQEPILIHSSRTRAAGMIRVFILSKAMEDIRDGWIKADQTVTLTPAARVGGAGSLNNRPDGTEVTVTDLMKLMITESDNTATNMLIDLLTIDQINDYIQRQGYTDTVLQRKMMDDPVVRLENDNFTSVKDLGTWFKKVYKHECVSKELDEQMIQLLLQQRDKDCIPNALSDSHKIAHETGELLSLYHDGGIIYTPAGDYILCILTDNQSSHRKTLHTMQQIVVQVDNVV